MAGAWRKIDSACNKGLPLAWDAVCDSLCVFLVFELTKQACPGASEVSGVKLTKPLVCIVNFRVFLKYDGLKVIGAVVYLEL